MAYDTVGAIWASPQNPSAPYQVTISPRYQTFRGNEHFNFTLTYNLPTSEYLKQSNWWGNYNLTISLFNDDEDLLITNATVRIIVPSGVSVTNLKLPSQSPVTPPFNVSDELSNNQVTWNYKPQQFNRRIYFQLSSILVMHSKSYHGFSCWKSRYLLQ